MRKLLLERACARYMVRAGERWEFIFCGDNWISMTNCLGYMYTLRTKNTFLSVL